jgi:hypothetical protein
VLGAGNQGVINLDLQILLSHIQPEQQQQQQHKREKNIVDYKYIYIAVGWLLPSQTLRDVQAKGAIA